jgi:hypothetical protein
MKTIKLLKIYDPLIDNYIFSSKRLEFGKNKKSYNGYESCGPVSYLLSYYLKKKYNNLDFKAGFTSIGYGKYYEDHLCILCDDIIIDPSYKQFLDSPYCTGKSKYSEYLYEILPPFFVGNKTDLVDLITNLQKLENDEFGKSSLNSKQILDWWKFNENPPYDLDLYKLVNEKDNTNSKLYGMINVINLLRNKI